MKQLLEIFRSFFKIGLVTFGGGYAMLPILEREAVEKKHWITLDDVMDHYAIAQCLPGIIGVNTSAQVGYRVRKGAGAIAAAVGFCTPSVIIITLIAGLIRQFSDLPAVQHAFEGIKICVAAVIITAVVKMIKKGVVDVVTGVIFVAALAVVVFTDISTIIVVLASVVLGVVIGLVRSRISAAGGGNKK